MHKTVFRGSWIDGVSHGEQTTDAVDKPTAGRPHPKQEVVG